MRQGESMYEAYPIIARPERERFEYFQEVIDRVFCPMSITPHRQSDGRFLGSVKVASLGRTRLAHVTTSPCTARRSLGDIARLTDSPYLVKFQLKGRAVWTQRNREVQLRPGDFVICSTAEPYDLRFLEDYSMPVLALPTSTMHELVPEPDQFLGIRMSGEDADCGLLTSFVAQVVARLGLLGEPMLLRTEANILDLLRTVLMARAKRRTVPEQQLRAIKAFVRQHIRDRRLGPAMIASEFGITRRYVHALFQSESMTLGHYIRAVRLEACRRELETTGAAPLSLTEFALSWGFYDLSHMSRYFREAFNESPTEVRSRALA